MVDQDDDHHSVARGTLERPDLRLVIPALVVAEVTYMIGRRLGLRRKPGFWVVSRVSMCVLRRRPTCHE